MYVIFDDYSKMSIIYSWAKWVVTKNWMKIRRPAKKPLQTNITPQQIGPKKPNGTVLLDGSMFINIDIHEHWVQNWDRRFWLGSIHTERCALPPILLPPHNSKKASHSRIQHHKPTLLIECRVGNLMSMSAVVVMGTWRYCLYHVRTISDFQL